jgi:hypothetical protein
LPEVERRGPPFEGPVVGWSFAALALAAAALVVTSFSSGPLLPARLAEWLLPRVPLLLYLAGARWLGPAINRDVTIGLAAALGLALLLLGWWAGRQVVPLLIAVIGLFLGLFAGLLSVALAIDTAAVSASPAVARAELPDLTAGALWAGCLLTGRALSVFVTARALRPVRDATSGATGVGAASNGRRALLASLATTGLVALGALAGRPRSAEPRSMVTPPRGATTPSTAGAPATATLTVASGPPAESPLLTPTVASVASVRSAQPTTIVAGASAVVAGSLSVEVGRGAWSVVARDGGREIFRELGGTAATSPYGSLAYQRAESADWQHLTAVQGVTALPDGQRFQVATTEANRPPATVDVTAVADGVVRVAFRPPPGPPVAWTAASVASDAADTLLGLGERFDRVVLSGEQLALWAADRREAGYGSATYLPVPWLLSRRGYGFWLDDPRQSQWELRSARPDAWGVRVPGPTLTYNLVGGAPAPALDRYTALTGRPPAVSPSALGVVKTLIGGEARVLSDAVRLQQASIPVDGLFVFDATDDAANVGWPTPTYDAIPRGTYPDVRRLTDALRALGYHPLAYFGPDFRPQRASLGVAAKLGDLVHGANGATWRSPLYDISLIDVVNPQAAAWWQEVPLRRAFLDLGFDGGMLDLGEAVPIDARFVDGQTGATIHNQYPVLLARAMDGAIRRWKPDATVWMRSGWTGAQAYERGTWSGDPVHSWAPVTGLAAMLPAALSAGLAGFAYWHTEVGGYVDGGLDPTSERELYLRWLQLGAFTAMLRDNYGDRRGKPTDLWTDDQTIALWRRYARIHRALGPYLQQAARVAQSSGMPLLRHLALAYPDDDRAWVEEKQYLLGPDLLVAPVIEPGARRRTVYLPAGAWRFWWTGQSFQGPAEVTVPAPVDQIPVFVRADGTSPLPDPSAIG